MKLLAVDGNNILYRAFFGVRLLSNKKGMYTNAIFGFLNILRSLQKEYKPDKTVIAFDLRQPTFRHLKYDAYKAGRQKMPPELAMQLDPLKEILTALGIPLLSCAGYEADDILGTIAVWCQNTNHSCVIASGDRDALQLVSECAEVCLVKTKENILYTPALFEMEYGIAPAGMIELKALMGDSSDNIPGIKGIGEKTALGLLVQHQTLELLYENLDRVKATPRIKKMLLEGKESAYLSRDLATIYTEVPLDCPLDAVEQPSVDVGALSSLLIELELFSFLKSYGLQQPLLEEQTPAHTTKVLSVTLNPTQQAFEEMLKQASALHFVATPTRQVFCFGSKLVVFDGALDGWLCEAVANSPLPKYTIEAKQCYKHIMAQGLSLQNLAFDVEIAAYLLRASAKEYKLAQLVLQYLPNHRYTLPEVWNLDESLKSVAALPDLCEALQVKLQQEQMDTLYKQIELPLCAVLAKMETVGFGVDKQSVADYGDQLAIKIATLKELIFEHAGEEFNPNSTKELGRILFEKLELPTGKKTKTGYSTNAEVLEKLKNAHPIVVILLEYRKLAKLHSTYVIGLLKEISTDLRIHSTFRQTETRTGRISSTEPNMQNIPVRTPEGSHMRRFFVAKEGYTLVDGDYSQIELRILAHIANDQNMIDAFAAGEDFHAVTASQVFGVPIQEVTPALRSRAKAINFGIVYGMGAFSLSQDIDTSVAEAKSYIQAYLDTYPGVFAYMERVVEDAKQNGYVTTLFGRRRELADINASNKMVQESAKRIALNTPIQGTAADIIKLAMIRVSDRLSKEKLDARMILQVHDELILEASISDAPTAAALLKDEMQKAAILNVALEVDVKIGKDWYTAKG